MVKFERLIDFDRQLLDWIVEKDTGHSKECILSAVNHLKMAYKIKDIDPEIALFRCITAEEEVARAIFLKLREQGYKNTNKNKIKDKDHKYKQALDLFLGTIQNHFVSYQEHNSNFPKEIQLILNENKKLLEVGLLIENVFMKSIPPLNFSFKVNNEPYYFKKELQELVELNSKQILKQIEEKANFRNKIIYAETKGILKFNEPIDAELDRYYKIVFRLIRIYCLIYPYKNEKSDFLQNAIDAYVFMMNEMEM
ncbi:MAG: hypothetical protein A3E21_04980 [Sulfurimonas sp. RIFCSPHIGHO2_12_FULL_36_9]|uniref:hypothetical protein n=1 Tax=Sulfurimonas sp. RIFCSPLOWO2_12_36_12 TaxID=1802253 RepID=UPI0008D4B959|nr:hypothetical protein [Sulfurimonas sp. RIFCSPLOWO2_12_36_12]OHD96892.1 MAG: hypothetical protein A3E21_04980 [Sulfurimonas sp. RIFCSPHIGHO2_12_FULL_36_9]OHD99873.1 MAG: hypothetical protein A3J26_08130 [Sulfurimonas sp. RIFCSPLOWO2_02_FULL_36_28]OHE01200.1 MAG: hypothetical protein A2W82_00790 [Sulfurimonas sp. RIFCSPLOWO2_12_36_12]OHE08465.1 MAG: hypothetical protein A3K14_05205 [Sulfurimonas sp. RIFCSPLOWO2_12_FULL_36_74]